MADFEKPIPGLPSDKRAPNENTSRIRDLKRKLYSRNRDVLKGRKRRSTLHPTSYTATQNWKTKAPKKSIAQHLNKLSPKVSFFKKFLIFSIIFFVAALSFAIFVFYGGSNTISTSNVDIAILGSTFAAGGEELNLQVEITNRNNIPLEFSDLLIEYPRGSSDGEWERDRKSLGTIRAGGTSSQNFSVILFGKEGSTKEIKITLEYRIKGSNAIFVKEEIYPITVSSSPISLSIDAPLEASSNQEITLNITSTLNASEIAEDIRLKIEYPSGFQFKSASPAPLLGNNIWDLGDLAPGVRKNILIRGELFGQDKEERSFRIYSGAGDQNDRSKIKVVYNSLLHTITIKRPFIEVKLLIDGKDQEEYAVNSESKIKARIKWSNNLSIRVQNVEISASLTGNAINKRSILTPTGFYSSSKDKIIWDKSTSSSFLSIEPGEKGEVSFEFSSLPLFTNTQSLISNPTVVIEVSIKGQHPTEGNIFTEVNNFETKTIKINSDFQLAVKGLYYSGPFINSGPIPPTAGEKTTYTIVWTIANSANKISRAEARASLPIYINWLGSVSPATEGVFYEEVSREVTWSIDSVKEGTGLSGETREIAFQVELLPSLSQIGSIPQLLGDTTLTGRDIFTDTFLLSTRNSVSTRLSSDSNFISGDDKVVE